MKLLAKIDINPPNVSFCLMGDEYCNRLIFHDRPYPMRSKAWCSVFDKELNVYGEGVARCIECTIAEREAKNDCKNNADA